MPVKTLEVIYIRDDQISPPGPKRVVCVEPFLGIFFRINSSGDHDGSVEIFLADHKSILKWDSFIECGDPLELDEYTIVRALDERGILGSINPKHAPAICDAVRACGILSRNDRNDIIKALGCD